MSGFLPMSRADMDERGWEKLDFIFVTGDAYVDHPSFGPAIITRVLERQGFKVGVIAQPDWRTKDDFKQLGRPKYAFLVSAGNLDSMLNKFTAAKKFRSKDNYSPGGRSGRRPERATIVYCNRLREAFKKTPIIIGGIEASLRRLAHYDYWDNAVRRSILIDSRADMLIYGMGERQIVEVAGQLQLGVDIGSINDVRGTAFVRENLDDVWNYLEIPDFEAVSADKETFARAFKLQYEQQDAWRGKVIAQRCGDKYVIQNPPPYPLTTEQMDAIYDLPYERAYHPSYEQMGGVPAIEEVKFSLVSHRGCFGGCSFCAILAHQGRIIQSRSRQSLLQEAQLLTEAPDFKGYIHDVGGPTANFRAPACPDQLERGACKNKQCLSPTPCKNLRAGHSDYIELLRALRALPKVKKVFIRSGIRYDYLLQAKDDFIDELCRHHISGQLKVAPEHVARRVTDLMGKSPKRVYVEFMEQFKRANERCGKEQYLVPYFMSSHPGATLQDAVELAEFIRDLKYQPEQVQDFIPTPGSLSTCMYYTERDPFTGEKLYVAKKSQDKAMQRALMQYRNPKNYELVYRALIKAGREDLIGFGAKCLIRPPKGKSVPPVKGGVKTAARDKSKLHVKRVKRRQADNAFSKRTSR